MMSKSPVDIHINDQNGPAEEEHQPEAYALPPLPVPVRPTSRLSTPPNLVVESNDDLAPKLPSRAPSPAPSAPATLYANLPFPTSSTQELYSTPPSPVPVKQQADNQVVQQQQQPEDIGGGSYAIPPTPVPAVAKQDRKCSLVQSKPKDSLEKCFDGVDTVMIKIVESNIPKTRRYEILDRNGRKIFDARKDTDGQGPFGSNRSFTIQFTDGSSNQMLFQLSRSFSLFPQFSQSIQAEAPNGTPLGIAKQHWSFGRTHTFTIIDSVGRTMLRIEGPCGDVGFIIYCKDKSVKLGKISTNWTGLDRATFTDNQDYFGISFPGNLSAKIKAVLLGACILVEPIIFMNKEQPNK